MIDLGKKVVTHAGYKAAFKCRKCPQSNGPEGCPVWWSLDYIEPTKDQKKTIQGCGLQLTAEYMVQMIKAANRPAEHISAMKNDMMGALKKALSAQADILEIVHGDSLSGGNGQGFRGNSGLGPTGQTVELPHDRRRD